MSLEEKLNQVKGSVKEGLGKLTGDTKQKLKALLKKLLQKQKKLLKMQKKLLKELSRALKISFIKTTNSL